MNALSTALTAHVTVDDGTPTTRIRCHLQWTPNDPLEVSLLFSEQDGTETVWEFARDLLIEGSTSPQFVGAGDVWVRASGMQCICIRLIPWDDPGGSVYVLLRREQVDWLIAESIHACRPGTADEADIVDRALDVELAELLDAAS